MEWEILWADCGLLREGEAGTKTTEGEGSCTEGNCGPTREPAKKGRKRKKPSQERKKENSIRGAEIEKQLPLTPVTGLINKYIYIYI